MVEQKHSFALGIFFETMDEHRVNITGCTLMFAVNSPSTRAGSSCSRCRPTSSTGRTATPSSTCRRPTSTWPRPSTSGACRCCTPEGYSSPVVKGYMQVNATPDLGYVDVVYDETNPPDSITAKILDNNAVQVIVNHLSGLVLEAGTATPLPAGQAPWVEIVGDYPYQILNLGLPSLDGVGSPGAVGPPGPPGPPGADSVVPGPPGPASTVPGPPGADSEDPWPARRTRATGTAGQPFHCRRAAGTAGFPRC